MLSNEELQRIYKHAYLPEHLPHYVEAISGAKPALLEGYLSFVRKNHLIFNGYPLGKPGGNVEEVYRIACERFRPATVAILAPELWSVEGEIEERETDQYYRLSLPFTTADSGLAYMVRRGKKELSVGSSTFGREHKLLIREFLKTHHMNEAQTRIYSRAHNYLKRSRSSLILEARKGHHLVAFSVVDFGATKYAFFLFHFRSEKWKVPGASDLLFNEMVSIAQSEGKKAINLGLGIHPGVRRFKEKWGGRPFLPYRSAFVHGKPTGMGALAQKL